MALEVSGLTAGYGPVTVLRGIDFRARLAAVEQPVLIVNGSKDKLFVEQEASFLAVARRASSHRFEGCDHGVSLRRSSFCTNTLSAA